MQANRPRFHVRALAAILTIATGAKGAEPAAPSATAPATAGRTSALSWVRQPGAESCIGAPALAAAVEKLLERRVFVPPAEAEVSVEGSIAYAPARKKYHASFRVADRDGRVLGERELDESAPSCDRLDEKLAFVVSLLIDPDGALAESPASPAPPPEPPAEKKAAAAEPKLPSPSPPLRARAPWHWFVGADFGGAAGVIPAIGWSVAAGAFVSPPGLPALRLRASSFSPNSQRFEGGVSADVALVTGELAICALELRQRTFAISACAGGLVGELSGRGDGFAQSRTTSLVFGALALGVLGELHLTHAFGLTLTPSLLVPVSKTRLAYEDETGARRSFFEVSSVGASLALGFAVGKL